MLYRCRALFMVLFCLLAISGCNNDKAEAPKAPALKVVLAEAVRAEIMEEARFNATLTAKETVEVRSRISGYLVERLFEEGATVKQGDVIYRLDDRDLKASYETAKANTAKAEATWKNNELIRDRYIPLAKSGAISVQDRDSAVAKAAEAQAYYDAAKANEEKAAVTLSYATIVAPTNGFINRSSVDVGGYVQAGSALLTTIYRTDPIRAEFSITDREFARFKQLMMEHGGEPRTVMFRMELGDNRIPYQHEGVLEMADPVVDSKTNTMGVRAEFPNPDRALRPGLYVNVIGMLGKRDVLMVPEVAIVERGGDKAVFVVDEKNTLVAVPVQIGALNGENRVVLGGLEPGRKVVVEGLVMAQPGMLVEVVDKAGQNPPADGKPGG